MISRVHCTFLHAMHFLLLVQKNEEGGVFMAEVISGAIGLFLLFSAVSFFDRLAD